MRTRILVVVALLAAVPLVALVPAAEAWGMCTDLTGRPCAGTLCVTQGTSTGNPSDCNVVYVP